jgi:cobalt-zinc-cadmium efflux system membrane fusion protein
MNKMKKVILILIVSVAVISTSCNNAQKEGEHNDQHTEEATASDEHAEEGHIEEIQLTPEHVKDMGLVVEPLKGGLVNSKIQRPATVMFNPDKTVKMGPRISAKVEKVEVDLGQRVTKGQALVYLSSVELGKIKANYLSLLSRFQTKEKAYKREKTLYEEQISSEADYLQAKAQFENVQADLESSKETLELFGIVAENVGNSDNPLSYFVLKSPLSGVVQERNLSPGQTLSPNTTPLHIVNNSEMWVMIDAYEQDIAHLQTGQTIHLNVKSLPGEVFTGKTDWISNALDKDSRTLKVKAIVSNKNGMLKEGMYGTASILNSQENVKPIIPVDAVQRINNETVVFVPGDEEGSFKPLEVVIGEENNGWVEIAGNIKIGDPVVTNGAFDLMSTITSKTRSAAHGH